MGAAADLVAAICCAYVVIVTTEWRLSHAATGVTYLGAVAYITVGAGNLVQDLIRGAAWAAAGAILGDIACSHRSAALRRDRLEGVYGAGVRNAVTQLGCIADIC